MKSYSLNTGGDVIYDRGFFVSVVHLGRLQYGHKHAAYVCTRLLLVDQGRVHDFGNNTVIMK